MARRRKPPVQTPAAIERTPKGQFPPGKSGNPGGRPAGIVEAVPRSYVKRLVLGVIQGNEELVKNALLSAAKSHRSVVTVLDHAAKLNREIGSGADGGGGNTVINIHTNVNMLRLKQAAPRAAQIPQYAGAGEDD